MRVTGYCPDRSDRGSLARRKQLVCGFCLPAEWQSIERSAGHLHFVRSGHLNGVADDCRFSSEAPARARSPQVSHAVTGIPRVALRTGPRSIER